MNLRRCCVLLGWWATLVAAGLSAHAQFTLPLKAGLNAIAVQTRVGTNALHELIGTLEPLPSETAVLTHHPVSGSWMEARPDPSGGWQPDPIVEPGSGFFLFTPRAFPFVLHSSSLPGRSRFRLAAGTIALRAAPAPIPTTWDSAIEGPPNPGDRVFRWNGQAYETFAWSVSGWIPREPSVPAGEALWFSRGPTPPGPGPYIVQSPTDFSALPGGEAKFEVWAEALPRTGYQWFRDNLPIESPFGPALVLPQVSSKDDGAQFSVVVGNRFGAVTSRVARLRVEGRVGGRLLRADGRPLRDQPIALRIQSVGHEPVRVSSMTDAAGRFQIRFPCDASEPSQRVLESEICPGREWPVPSDGCAVELGDLLCPEAIAPTAAPRGLGLWLPFNETNGPVAHNLAGGNNGTHFDAPTVARPGTGPVIVPEFVRSGLRFDGRNDQVEVPSYPEIEFGMTDLSLGAWLRADFLPTDTRTILDKLEFTGPFVHGYQLAVSQGQLRLILADGIPHEFLSPGQPIFPDGRWHFVVVTVERQNVDGLGVVFYVDGVPSPPLGLGELSGSIASPARFIVGGPTRDANGPPGRFNGGRARPASPTSGNWQGDLDEICAFCRALTRAEIEELVAAGQAGMVFVCLEPIALAVWNAATRIRFDVVLPNYSGKTTGAKLTSYDLSDLESCTARITQPPSKSVIVPVSGRIEPMVLNPPSALNQAGQTACLGLLSVPFEPVTPARRWRYHFEASPNLCATPEPAVETAPAGTLTTLTMAVTNAGPAQTLALRLTALDPRGGPATNLSVNGAPYGTPAFAQLTLPAGTVGNLPVTARFFTHDPGVYYPLQLAVADATGTNYQPLATALLQNVILGTRPLRITAQPADAFVERGTRATVTLGIADAQGAAQFEWRRNGSPLLNATNSFHTVESVDDATTGFFDCVVIDADGALVSDSAVLLPRDRLVLETRRRPTAIELTWPLWLFQFLPESQATLAPLEPWEAVEAASEFDGRQFQLQVPLDSGQRWFRLRK